MNPADTAGASPGNEAPAVTDVESLLDAANDDRDVIWLWRMVNGDWAMLAKLPPAGLRDHGIQPTVQQLYGGGKYKAKIRTRNAVWGPSRQFSIEGPPKTPAGETPAPAAAAAPIDSGRTSRELPAWVEKIVLPIGVALGTSLANKLLSDPKTDPLLLELIRANAKSGGPATDPIELQKLIAEAEERGERRGRELGELTAGADRIGDATGTSGVVDAIREAAPLVTRFLDHAKGPSAPINARVLPPPSPSPSPVATAIPERTDIVPAWLRPFMPFKPFLLTAADSGATSNSVAGMVIENSDDATWAEIDAAQRGGRLESDVYAAIPELRATSRRQAFVTALIVDLTAALDADRKEAAKRAKKTPAPAATTEAANG